MNACKCAMDEGVAPGAGATLFRVKSGSDMLDKALCDVTMTVQANAEVNVAIQDSPRQTVNVLTGAEGDFLEVGVVDATKVLRTAVENAASIATILFSLSGIITNKREEK